MSVQVKVRLPDETVEFIDAYAERHGLGSRTAVSHKAVRLLRASELGDAYADAWAAWAGTDDSTVWESATGDGLE